LFCAKCAEKAAKLDDDDHDTPAAIRSAQEVVAELAAIGIKRGLSRARDEIDRILKSRSGEDVW
jgi:hypothetical protein